MTGRAAGLALAAVLVALATSPVSAFDPKETFRQGTYVLSGELGGGTQNNLERHRFQSDLAMANAGVRYSILPFGPTGSGFFFGALEAGLEPFYQRYTHPDAFYAGLATVFRYHFLSLGRFVPWVEVFAAAGGTDLRVFEINSTFAFLLQAGVGASYFVTDRTAVYAGYRLEHVSNSGISNVNRGFEADTGVIGVSFFLP
jgi:opacity protein-like surface antigen